MPVLIGEATFEEGGNQGVAYRARFDGTQAGRRGAQEEHERLRQLESELAHHEPPEA